MPSSWEEKRFHQVGRLTFMYCFHNFKLKVANFFSHGTHGEDSLFIESASALMHMNYRILILVAMRVLMHLFGNLVHLSVMLSIPAYRRYCLWHAPSASENLLAEFRRKLYSSLNHIQVLAQVLYYDFSEFDLAECRQILRFANTCGERHQTFTGITCLSVPRALSPSLTGSRFR